MKTLFYFGFILFLNTQVFAQTPEQRLAKIDYMPGNCKENPQEIICPNGIRKPLILFSDPTNTNHGGGGFKICTTDAEQPCFWVSKQTKIKLTQYANPQTEKNPKKVGVTATIVEDPVQVHCVTTPCPTMKEKFVRIDSIWDCGDKDCNLGK